VAADVNEDGNMDLLAIDVSASPNGVRFYAGDGTGHFAAPTVISTDSHSAGALVAVNFMISPEAQYEKLKPGVWGDGTVLAVARLAPPWPERFAHVPERRYAPKRSDIEARALMELAPEYMIRIFDDFRTHVLAR
jgi:ABC-type uncharacterized transport system YnjBCD substrate-binding protein